MDLQGTHLCFSCVGDERVRAQAEARQVAVPSIQCARCGQTDHGFSLRDARLYFEWWPEVYVPAGESTAGRSLGAVLCDDWGLFREAHPSDELLLPLLVPDLDGVNLVPRPIPADNEIGSWHEFATALKERNRYFAATLRLNHLERTLARWSSPPTATPWFRARIWRSSSLPTQGDLMAPPLGKARGGRLNPIGIPYLYLADSVETAIAEVRPQPGDRVAVAEFQLVDGAFPILDLRNAAISAFDVTDHRDVLRDVQFLRDLTADLQRPVLPDDGDISYLPTQYFCEWLKSLGHWRGLLYRSTLRDGATNCALFDPRHAEAVKDPGMHCIVSLAYTSREV